MQTRRRRAPRHPRRRSGGLAARTAGAALLVAVLAGTGAQADSGPAPDGAAGADLVVTGVVEEVRHVQGSRQIARVRVESGGNARTPDTIWMSGDPLDPGDAELVAGTRIHAVLKRDHRPSRQWGSPHRYRAASGRNSVQVVPATGLAGLDAGR